MQKSQNNSKKIANRRIVQPSLSHTHSLITAIQMADRAEAFVRRNMSFDNKGKIPVATGMQLIGDYHEAVKMLKAATAVLCSAANLEYKG